MKRAAALLLAAATLGLLSGCGVGVSLPYAREIEGTAFVRVLGVDVSGDRAAALAVTAAAEEAGAPEPVVFGGSADTLSAAVLSLETEGTGEVSLAYVGQLLLGEGAAQRGAAEAINYALQDGTIGLDATVWVVRGGAAADAVAGTPYVSERLQAIETDAGIGGVPFFRSIKETAASLAAKRCAFVPALTVRESTLVPAGYAIFRDGALAGYADDGAARGMELLLGETVERIAEVRTPAGALAAFRITGARTKVTPVFTGDTLSGLAVACTIKAELVEARGGAGQEELCASLRETEEAKVRSALTLSQGLGADYLSLGEKAALSAPWRKAALEAQWDGAFSALPLSITIKVQLLS